MCIRRFVPRPMPRRTAHRWDGDAVAVGAGDRPAVHGAAHRSRSQGANPTPRAGSPVQMLNSSPYCVSPASPAACEAPSTPFDRCQQHQRRPALQQRLPRRSLRSTSPIFDGLGPVQPDPSPWCGLLTSQSHVGRPVQWSWYPSTRANRLGSRGPRDPSTDKELARGPVRRASEHRAYVVALVGWGGARSRLCSDVRRSRAGVVHRDRAGRCGVTSGQCRHIAGWCSDLPDEPIGTRPAVHHTEEADP